MKRISGYPLTIGVCSGELLRLSSADIESHISRQIDTNHETILVLEDIPNLQLLVKMSRLNDIKGIVFPKCYQYSHLAGLVNYWGIPSLAIHDYENLEVNQNACLDANLATLLLPESDDDWRTIDEAVKEWQFHAIAIIKRSKEPAKTISGISVNVLAEILNSRDIEIAKSYGADGIGEVRVELVQSESGLSIQSTTELLHKIVDSTCWWPIPVRFFDFGGEKTNPLIRTTVREASPLGLRGIRILRKDGAQLVNLFSKFVEDIPEDRLMITLPMVSNAAELKEFIQIFPRKIKHLAIEAETPACVYSLEEMLPMVDHVVIGPSDLTQFVLAMDRYLIDPSILPLDQMAPPVLDMIAKVVSKCFAFKVETSISLDFRPTVGLAKQLIEVGIRNITVPPRMVPFWKSCIREVP
jgi:phosphocarrier protein